MIALVMVFSQGLQAQNARLSILRPSGSVTHQWVYMPSGEIGTQQGLQNKQYPLQKLPSETYLESEFIAIEGCDLGLTVRHYVSTKRTHPIKIELIDETNDVLYSFSIPATYGLGGKIYLNSRFKIHDIISLYLKVCETIYANKWARKIT